MLSSAVSVNIPEFRMIVRLAGSRPTRCRAVVHSDTVSVVATSPDKAASMYEQTRKALADIDASLAEAGSRKAKILTAMVYIADMALKPEMNRAWDEWADVSNPPMRACVGAALEGKTLVEFVITAAK
jgi:enamine deaminase RidA (YjgF/YER057c/UK114 family)